MKDDPVLQRVRQARHRISEKWDHDPKKPIEYYIQRQKRHQQQLVGYQELVPKNQTDTA